MKKILYLLLFIPILGYSQYDIVKRQVTLDSIKARVDSIYIDSVANFRDNVKINDTIIFNDNTKQWTGTFYVDYSGTKTNSEKAPGNLALTLEQIE